MKPIRSIIALIAITVATAASADNGRQPYHSNGTFDNTFVTVRGGVNAVLDNGCFNIGGPAVGADLGKWLTPFMGVRLGWQGITNRAEDTSNGWFAGEDSFGFHYVHVDWMWNATNSIFGTKERLVNAYPFLKAGVIATTHDERTDCELGAGFGIDLDFRITRRLSLELQAAATLAREEAWRSAGKVIAFPSATAGLSVAFGRTAFDRHTDTVREVVVKETADCNHEAEIAALRDEIARLRALPHSADTVSRALVSEMAVYFTIDKWDLSVRENWHLKDLVDILPADASLLIVGHADKETGSHARNELLSRNRVETVSKALRDLGFRGSISSDHKGDTANPFDEPFQKNRCVTIRVILH